MIWLITGVVLLLLFVAWGLKLMLKMAMGLTAADCTREPSDPTLARCYDCAHLRGYVTWWCTNQAAIDWRGTSLPGVYRCWFWRGYDGAEVAPEVAARNPNLTEVEK